MEQKDTYLTLKAASKEQIYKEKKSKFLAYAFPIKNKKEVIFHLQNLKKKHPTARHFCYAYRLGINPKNTTYKVSDDGEPNNSAGMPIYGQIQSYHLTNCLVVVVRYFGGVKLGVGGLIKAYKTAAKQAIEAAAIIKKLITSTYEITFPYKQMNAVMRVLKEKNISVIKQELEVDCKIYIAVRKSSEPQILELFHRMFAVEIRKLN